MRVTRHGFPHICQITLTCGMALNTDLILGMCTMCAQNSKQKYQWLQKWLCTGPRWMIVIAEAKNKIFVSDKIIYTDILFSAYKAFVLCVNMVYFWVFLSKYMTNYYFFYSVRPYKSTTFSAGHTDSCLLLIIHTQFTNFHFLQIFAETIEERKPAA